jgi:fatty acid synthase
LQVGDAAELKAITLAFCKDRKTPLLIGSVKSNIGHTEGAAGLCAITKVIIGMETGFIPPNLHYNNPREGVESLVNGQLKVNIDITAE